MIYICLLLPKVFYLSSCMTVFLVTAHPLSLSQPPSFVIVLCQSAVKGCTQYNP